MAVRFAGQVVIVVSEDLGGPADDGKILLRHIHMLDGRLVVVLLESSQSRSAVVLRAAAALLVAEVLPGVGGEQAWSRVNSHRQAPAETRHSPTCSAFSQLRFILD